MLRSLEDRVEPNCAIKDAVEITPTYLQYPATSDIEDYREMLNIKKGRNE